MFKLKKQSNDIFGKFEKLIGQTGGKLNSDEVLYTSGGKPLRFNSKMSKQEQEVYIYIFKIKLTYIKSRNKWLNLIE